MSEEITTTILDFSTVEEIMVNDLANPSKQVPFKYLKFPASQGFSPDKLTVIYLPGGPGGYYSDDKAISVKRPYQEVFIDPRGTGVNLELGIERPDLLSSQGTVLDTAKVIKHLGLKNYIIDGISYASITATMLVHYLEQNQDKYPQPLAVVLSGVFGKAIPLRKKHDDFYGDAYDLLVDDLFQTMSSDAIESFVEFKKLFENHSSYSQKYWHIVNTALYLDPRDRDDELIRMYSEENKKQTLSQSVVLQENITKDMPSFDELLANNPSKLAKHLNTWIACKELFDVQTTEQQKIYTGIINYEDKSQIPCLPVINSPNLYNPEDYQITKTPVIYLQGFNDYQTPFNGAIDHLLTQRNLHPDSSFLLIIGANHSPFSNRFKSCLFSFESDLANKDWALPQTRECARQKNVTIKDYIKN